MKLDIAAIQEYLKAQNLDGWLIYDFHGINPVASKLSPFHGLVTRRWYMLIPSEGQPVLLAHAVEASLIDADYVETRLYSSWKMLEKELNRLLKDMNNIAMEYSPNCAIPYISRVDAGTIELIRSFDVNVVSSANLVQHFQARWSEEEFSSHKIAASILINTVQEAWKHTAKCLSEGRELNERMLQEFIINKFHDMGLIVDEEPIVAVNENAAKPHYAPTKDIHSPIKEGDLLLLDIFARQNGEHSISADITWTCYVGKDEAPEKMQEVFRVVAAARDAGVDFINERLWACEQVMGWEVDEVVYNVIVDAGYGDYVLHRTGHSLGKEIHSNGVNMDNFESKDERILEPGLGFTIEPGIYIPGEFGIRSEINCYVGDKGLVVTTLPMQTELKSILK